MHTFEKTLEDGIGGKPNVVQCCVEPGEPEQCEETQVILYGYAGIRQAPLSLNEHTHIQHRHAGASL